MWRFPAFSPNGVVSTPPIWDAEPTVTLPVLNVMGILGVEMGKEMAMKIWVEDRWGMEAGIGMGMGW